jgi:tetrapyrrole methylase family protein / MazG family protein
MPEGITIVGLGPGHPDLLTVEALRVLSSASEVYARTSQHPTLSGLKLTAQMFSFDEVYERAASFDDVYAEIAQRVVDLGSRPQGVVYAVPGHPLTGEDAVGRILALAEARGLPVHIVEGISFIEPICSLLHLDPMVGLQIGDATELALRHYSQFSVDLPLLIGQLYDRQLASDVKLLLMAAYPDEHQVSLIQAAGTPFAKVETVSLYALDRQAHIDHLTSLYIPPLSQPGSIASFQELVAHLRSPEGCPWDREQTHSTLRPYLLEETYEVLQALDAEDTEALADEMGDLLLQILLHTQIAIEDGEFCMHDVVEHIVSKLRRRHPHVFADVQVSGAQQVLANWEQIKRDEKAKRPRPRGLDGISLAMPALLRAQSLQERASRVGFAWPDAEAAWSKAREEWSELERAPKESKPYELGDLLFALVNLARWLEVDAETVLREAMVRFEGRFAFMEEACATQGRTLQELSQEDWQALWSQSKKRAAGLPGGQPLA